jgi:hypothetical protein
VIGEKTFNEAIGQASGGPVTVQLPAEASESGKALEFPAQSLNDLNQASSDLVIVSGNRTLRFPSGSIKGISDMQAHVRIVMNASWSQEAQSTVSQSIQTSTDYASTGVVLSVVIQLISGSTVTEIHQLDKPAVVNQKLTDEQQKQVSANLAGVYYVDGQKLEYVGGTLKDGVLTFTATHFSYYALLQYNKLFIDMKGHWAENEVKMLAAKHIVTGVDDTHYVPNRSITRAEFVTLVMRALDWNGTAAGSASGSSFSDVKAGQYYTDAVAKASALGIVSGYGGAFRPNDNITREEAVVALVRAANQMKYRGTGGQGKPAFADAASISAWAAAFVDQAWTKGLIQGDGTKFKPHSAVTRAEVAVMVNRLINNGQ